MSNFNHSVQEESTSAIFGQYEVLEYRAKDILKQVEHIQSYYDKEARLTISPQQVYNNIHQSIMMIEAHLMSMQKALRQAAYAYGKLGVIRAVIDISEEQAITEKRHAQ